MTFLLMVICRCLPLVSLFTCGPHSLCDLIVHSVLPSMGQRRESNSMALSCNLAAAACVRACASAWTRGVLWVRQSRTDNQRGPSNALHSALVLIWRARGTNIKEDAGFFWRGDKKEQQEHIMSLLDYSLPAWLSVLPQWVLASVGGFGLTWTHLGAPCQHVIGSQWCISVT